MNVFSNGGMFTLFKKVTEPLYKLPRSVQRLIPVYRISENGVFEIEKKKGKHLYDKAYELVDFNYEIENAKEQEESLQNYCKLLNIFNTSFKIVIANHRKDMSELKKQVLLENSNDIITQNFNEIIKKKILEGKNGVEQVKYLVVTTERENYEDACNFFHSLEGDIKTCLQDLGSAIIPLDWKARLKTLHYIYRLGEEIQFSQIFADLAWEDLQKRKIHWKDEICSVGINQSKNYFEMGNKICCVLFARNYPSLLKDTFLAELSNVNFHTLVTLDVAPIPDYVARDRLRDIHLSIESNISKQQEVRNKNNMFSTEISYDKRREKDQVEEYMEDVDSNDESMFYVGLYVTILADSMEELNTRISSIKTIGDSSSLKFEVHSWNQIPAFNTSLPLGGRFVKTMRPFLTQCVGIFMPFYAQELQDTSKDALYYGTNQLSKKLVLADRKSLPNGNGFVFGTTGSGKGVFEKQEFYQVLDHTNDEIIIIDPQNEYFDMVEDRNGQVIDICLDTDHYINPLHIPNMEELRYDKRLQGTFIAEKTDFMLSICEQIKEAPLTAGQKSIIDECVGEMYRNVFNSSAQESPTMSDFQKIMAKREIIEARDLTLALRLFTEGSLNIFSHQNTVDLTNRVICFGINNMGKNIKPLAMLVMLESIQHKVEENFKRGIATRINLDEFHELTGMDYSEQYLEKLWKKIRKLGGLCTGITQNLSDCTMSKKTATLVSNSAYIVLLKQSEADIPLLKSTFNLTDPQVKYLINKPLGTGLMKFGDKWIPFDNTVPKESHIYKMVNTNMHEKVLQQSLAEELEANTNENV